MSNLVIVESPAKAKTIEKYLGPDYSVLASYGHVRDLPSKSGMVEPDNKFAMHWAISPGSSKHIEAIYKAAKSSDSLLLATDPDREGEAIAWHILEELLKKKAFPSIPVKRVVFNEITKNSVMQAIQNPREISSQLVDSYLARRALDYLVGFTLSPVLWRKVPGARSAGRVQSVALRMVCARELEIEKFQSREYWRIAAAFKTSAGNVAARLSVADGKKVEKFTFENQEAADKIQEKLRAVEQWNLAKITQRETQRNPAAPFTTSTLQQEAFRKLGFSPTRTMTIAQKLYEGLSINGENTALITYMRTDSVQMGQEAIASVRKEISDKFGAKYLPASQRHYKTKTRNAQEAHECIRAIDFSRHPDSLNIESDMKRLYQLIWQRSMSSQMTNATFDETVYLFDEASQQHQLRASGRVQRFDGFLRLYQEGTDDEGKDSDDEKSLPLLEKDQKMPQPEISGSQHKTEPPPRYTEASLIKAMEAEGIGRPSTYASILRLLRDRKYIDGKRSLKPSSSGRVLTAFLEQYFEQYVAYNFTADMEVKLDLVASGDMQWRKLLENFWTSFKTDTDKTLQMQTTEIIDRLDEALESFLFPAESPQERQKLRLCPECKKGRLGLKLSRHGGFVGCSQYPECGYTRPLFMDENQTGDASDQGQSDQEKLPKALGEDPETKTAVTLRRGPYGLYLHRESTKPKEKAKMASVPAGENPWEVTLERAVQLLSLPRKIGKHPETNKEISAAYGRFGPYVRHDGMFASLAKDVTPFDVGINMAVSLLEDAKKRKANRGGRKFGKAKAPAKATKATKATKAKKSP